MVTRFSLNRTMNLMAAGLVSAFALIGGPVRAAGPTPDNSIVPSVVYKAENGKQVLDANGKPIVIGFKLHNNNQNAITGLLDAQYDQDVVNTAVIMANPIPGVTKAAEFSDRTVSNIMKIDIVVADCRMTTLTDEQKATIGRKLNDMRHHYEDQIRAATGIQRPDFKGFTYIPQFSVICAGGGSAPVQQATIPPTAQPQPAATPAPQPAQAAKPTPLLPQTPAAAVPAQTAKSAAPAAKPAPVAAPAAAARAGYQFSPYQHEAMTITYGSADHDRSDYHAVPSITPAQVTTTVTHDRVTVRHVTRSHDLRAPLGTMTARAARPAARPVAHVPPQPITEPNGTVVTSDANAFINYLRAQQANAAPVAVINPATTTVPSPAQLAQDNHGDRTVNLIAPGPNQPRIVIPVGAPDQATPATSAPEASAQPASAPVITTQPAPVETPATLAPAPQAAPEATVVPPAIAELNFRITGIQDDVTQQHNNMAKVDGRVTAQGNSITGLIGSVDDLGRVTRDQATAIEGLRQRANQTDTGVLDLNKRVDQAEKILAQLSQRLGKLGHEVVRNRDLAVSGLVGTSALAVVLVGIQLANRRKLKELSTASRLQSQTIAEMGKDIEAMKEKLAALTSGKPDPETPAPVTPPPGGPSGGGQPEAADKAAQKADGLAKREAVDGLDDDEVSAPEVTVPASAETQMPSKLDVKAVQQNLPEILKQIKASKQEILAIEGHDKQEAKIFEIMQSVVAANRPAPNKTVQPSNVMQLKLAA